jgi:hypothetical protein
LEMRPDSPLTLTEREDHDPEVGAQPPRIEDLLPPPSSPVAIARGIGSTTDNFTTHVSDDPHAPDRPKSDIPDFAPGRGGDGIGGVGLPSIEMTRAASEDRHRKQKDTLSKLRVILAW